MNRPLGLFLLALAAAGLLALLHHVLAPRIALQQELALERQLLDLLPAGSYDNHPLREGRPLPASGLLQNPQPASAWIARLQGRPVAVLLPVSTRGYRGPITLLVAIAADGRLIGSKVLSHQETPGLGSQLAEGDWLTHLAGRRLDDPAQRWQLRDDGGEIDQIAGATRTSQASLDALQRALRFHAEYWPIWTEERP